MLTTDRFYTLKGKLTPRPPFDFARTLGFLEAFSPTAGEQVVAASSITKAVTLHGRPVAFEVSSAGPELTYTLYAQTPLSKPDQAALSDRIRFFLSLDDDLQPFYDLGRADPDFTPVIERLYGLHQPKFLTPFEIACWAILAQRIPMPIAHRTKMALVERWGTSIQLQGGTYHAFPDVEQLAAIDENDLLAVVGNRRKVEYLRSVIALFQAVDEQELRSGDLEDVMAKLRGVRGIGEWSAYFILVRGLGRMERVSAVDRELARAAARIYKQGQALTTVELARILDHYGTSQGYWAFYARNAFPYDAPAMMAQRGVSS
jgi:DNA-3-methyladenine glycosylase II